jgi:hypothetical protein
MLAQRRQLTREHSAQLSLREASAKGSLQPPRSARSASSVQALVVVLLRSLKLGSSASALPVHSPKQQGSAPLTSASRALSATLQTSKRQQIPWLPQMSANSAMRALPAPAQPTKLRALLASTKTSAPRAPASPALRARIAQGPRSGHCSAHLVASAQHSRASLSFAQLARSAPLLGVWPQKTATHVSQATTAHRQA